MLNTMDEIAQIISLVVEAIDSYTAAHQRRVAEFANLIAKEMGLPEWEVNAIRVGGLIHDVGKIRLPTEILCKPGQLDEYEFDIVKTHPRIGSNILKMVKLPESVTEAVLQHHERWDGSGYPQGLSGMNIILEARILGVADVIEAMSSQRPYRPSLGLEGALRELSRGRNILYDVEVVDASLKLCNKGVVLGWSLTSSK